MNYPKLISIY